MEIDPERTTKAPGYPVLTQHRCQGRCRRRKIALAAATLAVLGGAGCAGYLLAGSLRRQPLVVVTLGEIAAPSPPSGGPTP